MHRREAHTFTRQPRSCNERAAARPEIPAPITKTGSSLQDPGVGFACTSRARRRQEKLKVNKNVIATVSSQGRNVRVWNPYEFTINTARFTISR